jgi:hypothetical protein
MEDSIQKFSRLSHIANDFQLAAKTYAQIIGMWIARPCLLLVRFPRSFLSLWLVVVVVVVVVVVLECGCVCAL